MMIKKVLFIALLTATFHTNAANENTPIGSRSSGFANASVCLTDIWAVHHNQAALADLQSTEAGVNSQLLFPNSGVLVNAAALAVKTKYGVISGVYNRLGFKNLYTDNKVGIGFARKFGKTVAVGMQLDYLNTNIADNVYGKRSAIAVEVGVVTEFIKNLKIGIHVYNPARAKVSSYNQERVPTIMRLGMQYSFSTNVFLAAEVEKDTENKPIFKMGAEYHIIKELYLRAGIASNPSLNSAGFGLALQNLNIDFAASFHPQLGISPSVGIKYRFSKAEVPIVAKP